ncbi:MAG: Gfo/Idh/MocA family oxidoreductase [Chloroflexi bacterium]|nr:Gfo/Idh/MocA family oxidoreductase [Chloroflexota bacterium]
MVEGRLRIGVIGVGYGTQVQVPGFQSEGVEVAAVCAQREERARDAAEKFHIPHAFTDYRRMLEMDGLDAVSIVTPPALHHEMALAALAADKHVLCEKPFALDQAQAREMWEAAQRSNRTAMVGHEFRWAPQRAFVRELMEQDYVGRFNFSVASLMVGPRNPVRPRPYTQASDASLGGGFLFGLGSHYIDNLRYWFGEVTSVSGQVATVSPERVRPGSSEVVASDADDAFSFTLAFRNGGWAAMTGSNAAPFGSGARIEVYGSEGALVTPQPPPGFNPPSDGKVLGGRLGDKELAEIPMPARLRPFRDDRDDRLMAFRLMVRVFLQGIAEGRSPAPNFYDGYRCQQVLDAVRESSRTGRTVDIPAD